VELLVRLPACWAEGVGIRATARVFEIAPHTGLPWWGEAAEQLRAFAASLLCNLPLEPRPLDALSAVRRDLKAGESNNAEALRRLERSPYWVWTALDPKSTRLLVVAVGSCPLTLAQRVVPQGTEGLAPGCAPRVLTDGRKDSTTALLTHFGQWLPPKRRPDKGPIPKPRGRPLSTRRYAPGVPS
jgi:hypothetical protein